MGGNKLSLDQPNCCPEIILHQVVALRLSLFNLLPWEGSSWKCCPESVPQQDSPLCLYGFFHVCDLDNRYVGIDCGRSLSLWNTKRYDSRNVLTSFFVICNPSFHDLWPNAQSCHNHLINWSTILTYLKLDALLLRTIFSSKIKVKWSAWLIWQFFIDPFRGAIKIIFRKKLGIWPNKGGQVEIFQN